MSPSSYAPKESIYPNSCFFNLKLFITKREKKSLICTIKKWLSLCYVRIICLYKRKRAPFGAQGFLFEISLQQAFQCLPVACFIACHLVHGVVNCIEVIFLCQFCQFCFAFRCSVFGINPHLEILLC